ncbi:alcohol dehydrogenase catalytic domain-containing protein [Anaerovorax odorimutans]|uniref:Alcohol dehydrogenase catalytic domain-containing protein n=1 Tax=Anaerovorax odorimutans TaxID=109327 RepID=A0ABT1RRC6_9FIRM|nr:alcohol dehydrogenase catalytic domain-containing protein [Anaerovorax odorimutans]MCQ4637436.1 alcohol dehydrogenase catalytic domain-containing protein [Anaerovorax odorimutans]
MKALILKDYMQFEYIDIEKPVPGPKEVLIQIKAAAVCGSDIAGAGGTTGRRVPPIIMGHEASGIIERTGSKVTRFTKGDRVTFDSTIYCGECEFCQNGKVNLCNHRRVLGVSCSEYRQHGAFCQYIVLPEHIVYKIPASITFDQASLAEPISVALHAIKQMKIDRKDTVAVLGTGSIALFSVQLLKLLHPVQIIVIGRNEKKMEIAKELGADRVINSNKQVVVSAIRKITSGRGVNKVLDAAGAQSTFSQAIEILRKGGVFVTLANLKPSFSLNAAKLITRELTIKGSCAFSGELAEAIELLANDRIRVDYAISRMLPLSEGGEFIERVRREKPEGFFKCILHPDETGTL